MKCIKLLFCLLCFVPLSVRADDWVSIFSTTTDWEGISGLRLAEYSGTFIHDSDLIDTGLVLYYLDQFPCYGLGFGVRVWLGPRNKESGSLAIACIAAPQQLQFAWRNATREADQSVTTGILTCPVSAKGRKLSIDLSQCEKGPTWSELK